jgi:hypothetical protein
VGCLGLFVVLGFFYRVGGVLKVWVDLTFDGGLNGVADRSFQDERDKHPA